MFPLVTLQNFVGEGALHIGAVGPPVPKSGPSCLIRYYAEGYPTIVVDLRVLTFAQSKVSLFLFLAEMILV